MGSGSACFRRDCARHTTLYRPGMVARPGTERITRGVYAAALSACSDGLESASARYVAELARPIAPRTSRPSAPMGSGGAPWPKLVRCNTKTATIWGGL
jgi:hypothetical protein